MTKVQKFLDHVLMLASAFAAVLIVGLLWEWIAPGDYRDVQGMDGLKILTFGTAFVAGSILVKWLVAVFAGIWLRLIQSISAPFAAALNAGYLKQCVCVGFWKATGLGLFSNQRLEHQ